jgi:hypothetical protein
MLELVTAGALKGTALAGPLKLMGPVMTVIITHSAVQTAFDIQKRQSVGPLAITPFLSIAACGAVWAAYGMGMGYASVVLANAILAIGGLFCTSVYLKYSVMSPSTAGLIVVAVSVVFYSIFLAAEGSLETVGIIGDVVAVLLCASPLGTVSTVISERSTASMPFAMSCATWVNTMVSVRVHVHAVHTVHCTLSRGTLYNILTLHPLSLFLIPYTIGVVAVRIWGRERSVHISA